MFELSVSLEEERTSQPGNYQLLSKVKIRGFDYELLSDIIYTAYGGIFESVISMWSGKAKWNRKSIEASLTVEAALAMPVFLYLTIALLYFMQIFTLQEQIHAAITRMGLSLSRSAYFYKDFPDIEEALHFDKSVFGEELDNEIDDLTDQVMSGVSLKLYANRYLNKDWLNASCIVGGFDGISFFYSSLADEDCIDIVVNYRIRIPVKIFVIKDLNILQRLKLHAWTGYEVAAAYETDSPDNNETMVYVTDTGSVYHKDRECSHIKLSVKAVKGIPDALRNDNGGKYYKCEACCTGEEEEDATYYITSDGTRYHTRRDCSKIKRSVHEIPLSEIGDRQPCKRCYK